MFIRKNMSRFCLKVIWLEKSIGVALDQSVGEKLIIPITEYFFWPRSDAWEQLRIDLEAKGWISENDLILILNQVTEIINLWQGEGSNKKSFLNVKEKFPSSIFLGFN